MDYIVLEADNSRELSKEVTEHMVDGWKLQGGVSVAMYYDTDQNYDQVGYLYAQAMTKEQAA